MRNYNNEGNGQQAENYFFNFFHGQVTIQPPGMFVAGIAVL